MKTIICMAGVCDFEFPPPYYLKSYNPDARPKAMEFGSAGEVRLYGQLSGLVVITPDRAKAQRFDDLGEAFAAWCAVSQSVPLRPDGNPNRPLTAFTIVTEQVES